MNHDCVGYMTLLFMIMCIIDMIVLLIALTKGFSVAFTQRTKDTLMGANFLFED